MCIRDSIGLVQWWFCRMDRMGPDCSRPALRLPPAVIAALGSGIVCLVRFAILALIVCCNGQVSCEQGFCPRGKTHCEMTVAFYQYANPITVVRTAHGRRND